MTTLRQHLAATPRHFLLAIGRARRLRLPWAAPKASLVERLAQILADPAHLAPLLAMLSETEQTVLDDLLLAGGRLPRRHLVRRHGDLRPYRPWRKDSPRRPWEQPLSPTERLWYLGLIFLDRRSNELFIPTELQAHLPVPVPPSPAPPSPRSPTMPAPADLTCHDLAGLLALLQRDEIVPLHGRWLPPRFLAAWGRCCRVRPATPQARSELQTARRRFLHYLAEAGGWVAGSGERGSGSGGICVNLSNTRTDFLKFRFGRIIIFLSPQYKGTQETKLDVNSNPNLDERLGGVSSIHP